MAGREKGAGGKRTEEKKSEEGIRDVGFER